MKTERLVNAFKPFTAPVDRISKQRTHKPLPGQMRFDFDAQASHEARNDGKQPDDSLAKSQDRDRKLHSRSEAAVEKREAAGTLDANSDPGAQPPA
jgi:hypothetical protein